MKVLSQWLQGRKTYLTCLTAGVLLFGSWQRWWQLPAEIYAALLALATAFLRASIPAVPGPPLPGPDSPASGATPAPAAAAPQPQAGTVPPSLLAALASLLAANLLLTGCASLDPTGVYQGNQALYQADLVLASSYDALHGFVQWEYDNRAALNSTPAIRAAADNVRAGAPQWFSGALACRDACQTNSSAANQAALQQALAVLQQAVLQALRYQTTNPPAASPPPPASPPAALPSAPTSH